MPTIQPYTVIAPSAKIGVYVLIWHFTTVEDAVEIGDYVTIGGRCFIGRGTKIGSGCRIQDSVFLPRYSMIGRDVFIGPGVVATDDRYPEVNNHEYIAAPPILVNGCSIGAAAVLLPGVHVGKGAMVGA